MTEQEQHIRLWNIACEVRLEMEDKDYRKRIGEKILGYPVDLRLGGLCGRASGRIVTLARKAGIKGVRRTTSWDGGHVFVRWNGWLIDVTATQFNRRRPRVVFIREDQIKRRPDYWRVT